MQFSGLNHQIHFLVGANIGNLKRITMYIFITAGILLFLLTNGCLARKGITAFSNSLLRRLFIAADDNYFFNRAGFDWMTTYP